MSNTRRQWKAEMVLMFVCGLFVQVELGQLLEAIEAGRPQGLIALDATILVGALVFAAWRLWR